MDKLVTINDYYELLAKRTGIRDDSEYDFTRRENQDRWLNHYIAPIFINGDFTNLINGIKSMISGVTDTSEDQASEQIPIVDVVKDMDDGTSLDKMRVYLGYSFDKYLDSLGNLRGGVHYPDNTPGKPEGRPFYNPDSTARVVKHSSLGDQYPENRILLDSYKQKPLVSVVKDDASIEKLARFCRDGSIPSDFDLADRARGVRPPTNIVIIPRDCVSYDGILADYLKRATPDNSKPLDEKPLPSGDESDIK